MNSYPHNWTHTLRLDKEPWSNKLVRKAANYAIDRQAIVDHITRKALELALPVAAPDSVKSASRVT